MNISNLTFPLTVNFSGSKYWLNGEDPYQCGEAATAFLAGEIDCEPAGNPSLLTQELETVLKTFGSFLFPCAEEQETANDLYQQLKQSAATCSINYAFLPLKRSIVLAERYTFPTLRDFLYVNWDGPSSTATRPDSAAYAAAGSSTSRGTGQSTVSASLLVKQRRLAGR